MRPLVARSSFQDTAFFRCPCAHPARIAPAKSMLSFKKFLDLLTPAELAYDRSLQCPVRDLYAFRRRDGEGCFPAPVSLIGRIGHAWSDYLCRKIQRVFFAVSFDDNPKRA